MKILLLLLSLSSISTVFFSQYECVCGLISHIWAQKRDLENLLAGGGSPTLCATGISSLSLLVCVCVSRDFKHKRFYSHAALTRASSDSHASKANTTKQSRNKRKGRKKVMLIIIAFY